MKFILKESKSLVSQRKILAKKIWNQPTNYSAWKQDLG